MLKMKTFLTFSATMGVIHILSYIPIRIRIRPCYVDRYDDRSVVGAPLAKTPPPDTDPLSKTPGPNGANCSFDGGIL